MSKSRPRKNSSRRVASGDPRFRVYGLRLIVRMRGVETAPFNVQCPRGHPIQYGEVVSLGDGFDPEAGTFRDMPPVGSVVAFEETAEGVEGHFFFSGDDEYRILDLDALDMAFPPREE
jgi:hypothetical protein